MRHLSDKSKRIIKYLPQALGVLCVLGGFISLGFALTDKFKSEAERDDLLNRYVESMSEKVELTGSKGSSSEESKGTVVDTEDSELMGEGIADLTGDQKVKKIKDGMVVLDIPDLNIRVPVLEGTSYDVLKVAAGHFKGTGSVGKGNYCIAGHSVSSYACIFDNLHKVKMDLPVYLYDKKGKEYKYWVTEWRTVKPSDTWVINDYGDDRCTLITCDDNGKTRLVITALKMNDEEHEEYLREQAVDKRAEIKDLCMDYANITIQDYLGTRGRPEEMRYGFLGADTFKDWECSDVLLEKRKY